jgi:hypothetical protein
MCALRNHQSFQNGPERKDLAKAGAPIALIGPGPYWRPRRTSESDVVPPVA